MTASSKYKPTVGLPDDEMPRTMIWLSPTPRLLTWMDGSKRVKLSSELPYGLSRGGRTLAATGGKAERVNDNETAGVVN